MLTILFYALAALHGIVGGLGIVNINRFIAIEPTPKISRARIRYFLSLFIIGSIALILCFAASIQIPLISYWFALVSLLTYLLSPVYYSQDSPYKLGLRRMTPSFPIFIFVRIVGCVSLAVLANICFGDSANV